MIRLIAPETTTVLPNPTFSDSQNKRAELTIKRSINNTKRVYVKTADSSRLIYSFKLTKMKALELRAFILKYYDTKINMINHKNETWYVQFASNPFDFISDSVAQNLTGGEAVNISLTFEGVQL